MQILIASDKFKGALTQKQVNTVLLEVLEKFYPEASIQTASLSDGGDGFLESVRQHLPQIITINQQVHDPLGRMINTHFLFDPEADCAFIEFAAASGLHLLKSEEQDPLKTTSTGVGELIRAAMERGITNIYIGLGGSATNDAGMGIAHGLGFRFLDSSGRVLNPCGENLGKVANILPSDLDFKNHRIYAVNDVNNVLYGAQGAAMVYGPQKGADRESVALLDRGLRHFAAKTAIYSGRDHSEEPGSGAAGGAAFGLRSFTGAAFISGSKYVLTITGILDRLEKNAYDLVITGEGCIDDQTSHGKLVYGLGSVAAKMGIPVIAFCGINRLKETTPENLGLTSVISISNPDKSLEYNLSNAAELLREQAEICFRNLRRNY